MCTDICPCLLANFRFYRSGGYAALLYDIECGDEYRGEAGITSHVWWVLEKEIDDWTDYAICRRLFMDYHITRWGKEPLLMFVGEHTTPYHPSTIHGAYLSGIREAYRDDCGVDPVANHFMEFTEDHVYERTFHVKRPLRDTHANVRAASTPSEVDASGDTAWPT
jgi:Flavin containing amine oxidoreductase